MDGLRESMKRLQQRMKDMGQRLKDKMKDIAEQTKHISSTNTFNSASEVITIPCTYHRLIIKSMVSTTDVPKLLNAKCL